MKQWVLSAKFILTVGALSLGAVVYFRVPEARLVPWGFWGSLLVALGAIEVAWYLTELQTMRRPRLMKKLGLEQIRRSSYRPSSSYSPLGTTSPDGYLEIAGAHDIERDIMPKLISALTRVGGDNRFDLIIGPPGAGKTILLHRIASELLRKGYFLCRLSGEIPAEGLDPKALAQLSAGIPRLFILVDDVETSAGIRALLEIVLGGKAAATVVGTCSQRAYEAMLRGPGTSEVSPRDIVSLATAHHLKMTPHEAQAIHDQIILKGAEGLSVTTVQRQAVAAGAADPFSLAISLRYGCRPAAFAISAVEDIENDMRQVLVGLCLLGLAGRPLSYKLVNAALEGITDDVVQALSGRNLIARRGDILYLPHPSIALTLLLFPEMLPDNVRHGVVCSVIERILTYDRGIAHAIMRTIFYQTDSDFFGRVWRRCRELCIVEIEKLSPGEVVDDLLPLLLLAGELRFALKLCNEYAEHQALGRRARFMKGLCLYNIRSYTAAAEIFSEFLSSNAYRAAAHVNCALCEIAQGDYTEAGHYLKALEAIDERLAGLHYLMGYLAELEGQVDTAAAEYREARIQYGYDNASLERLATLMMLTGAGKEAIKLYEAGLQLDPDHVEYYGGLAIAHDIDGNASRAMVQSARAIQAGIDPAIARKTVAQAYMDFGLYKQAERELRNSLTYAPEDVEAMLLTARCLFAAENFAWAKAELQKAVETDPDAIAARYELASCLRDMDECDEAEEVVATILDATVATPEAYILAATVAACRGERSTQAARAALALEAGDETGWALFFGARAVNGEHADSYRAAITALTQVARTANRLDSAAAHLTIAVCQRELGNEEEAGAAAARARRKLITSRYAGEPVFSAVDARRITNREFMARLAEFGA